MVPGDLRPVVLERRPVLSAAPLLQVDKSYLIGTAIHLPLSSDGEQVDMIFGATRFSPAPEPATIG